MTRLPIRVRLTVAFAGAVALLIVLGGVLLHVRLAASLDESIDETLRARIDEAGMRLGNGSEPVSAIDDAAVQVIRLDGQIVAGTIGAGRRPLLDAGERARAGRDEVTVDRRVEGIDGVTRLLAIRRGELVVVAGVSLEDRDDALRSLDRQLVVLGPVALLIASLLGYGLAAAALRPVEAMRADAAAVTSAEPGRRLPLPAADDEVRRLGETLNAMLDRLEHALARERDFVADASHELRTPLTSLRAELELALRHPRTREELESSLRSAAAESERLSRLADDLLVLARSDDGGLVLRTEPVEVGALLERIAGRLGGAAVGAGRAIVVEPSPSVAVQGDVSRLEQAIGNLADNALRHGSGTVTLSVIVSSDNVELHVTDEGDGLPDEFIPRAFERFSRPEQGRPTGGAGLGLSIVDAVARSHGGSAHADNRSSGGADVWIALPAGPRVLGR